MKGQKGFTLLEVVISVLLTAIMVSSVMTVALSAKRSSAKADRKLIAAQANRQLTSMLKAFVADGTAQGQTLIKGPRGAAAGAASWAISDPSASPPLTDSQGSGVYALAPGAHTLTGFLPSDFEGPPYNARVTYTVGGGSPPQVTVTVNWAEPGL